MERNSFMNIGGIYQPAPAAWFDNIQLPKPSPPVKPSNNTKEILKKLGYDENEINFFKSKGLINF